jgi:hypothetical protein
VTDARQRHASLGAVIPTLRVGRNGRTALEFTVLFFAVTIVMLVAWRGSRSLALTLFGVTLLACVATYLHHATDALKLSF